jgi:uncharacterized membrane protein YfcA
VLGSLPGVVIGAVIRVELLPSTEAFYLVVAAVLGPLGAWLLVDHGKRKRAAGEQSLGLPIVALSLGVGIVGGIYGIGGGSILAPMLVALGYSVVLVAPAALTATFVTSIGGLAAFGLLSIGHSGSIAPNWGLGVALGLGGFCGGFVGARLQPLIPERLLTKGLGLLSALLAVRYLLLGL